MGLESKMLAGDWVLLQDEKKLMIEKFVVRENYQQQFEQDLPEESPKLVRQLAEPPYSPPTPVTESQPSGAQPSAEQSLTGSAGSEPPALSLPHPAKVVVTKKARRFKVVKKLDRSRPLPAVPQRRARRKHVIKVVDFLRRHN